MHKTTDSCSNTTIYILSQKQGKRNCASPALHEFQIACLQYYCECADTINIFREFLYLKSRVIELFDIVLSIR